MTTSSDGANPNYHPETCSISEGFAGLTALATVIVPEENSISQMLNDWELVDHDS